METDSKPKLRITISQEPSWRCDYCGAGHSITKGLRVRLTNHQDHPDIFDRCIDLCPDCAKMVARKIQLLTDFQEKSTANNGAAE